MLVLLIAFSQACDPQESTDHDLGSVTLSEEQIDFDYESIEGTNQLVFTNTTTPSVVYLVAWDFGNGYKANANTVTVTYNNPGEYNVLLTLITADGKSFSKTKVVNVN